MQVTFWAETTARPAEPALMSASPSFESQTATGLTKFSPARSLMYTASPEGHDDGVADVMTGAGSGPT